MKSRKVPMTIDEFHCAEFPFGWKDEYCDGFGYFTPREHGILMKISIAPRQINTFAEIRAATENDRIALTELFYESFVDSIEFCDLSKKQIKKDAAKNIVDYFAGERGIPALEISRLAVAPDDGKSLIGACLIAKYKYGYKNEILFVRPTSQNLGIGTALAANVLNDLHEKAEKVFWSEHHICNEQSAAWHRKFGFVEETDILTAKFRRNHYRHEVRRNERAGNICKVEELKLSLEQAEAEVERLEKIQETDFDAAWLRWKYDY